MAEVHEDCPCGASIDITTESDDGLISAHGLLINWRLTHGTHGSEGKKK